MNPVLVEQVILGLIQTFGPALATVATAKAENRDLTQAEVDALFAGNATARAALDAAIAAAP
jgi:hypothetical protein